MQQDTAPFTNRTIEIATRLRSVSQMIAALVQNDSVLPMIMSGRRAPIRSESRPTSGAQSPQPRKDSDTAPAPLGPARPEPDRPEERRVGNAGGSTGRSRGA